jgi:hypothetical protein
LSWGWTSSSSRMSRLASWRTSLSSWAERAPPRGCPGCPPPPILPSDEAIPASAAIGEDHTRWGKRRRRAGRTCNHPRRPDTLADGAVGPETGGRRCNVGASVREGHGLLAGHVLQVIAEQPHPSCWHGRQRPRLELWLGLEVVLRTGRSSAWNREGCSAGSFVVVV